MEKIILPESQHSSSAVICTFTDAAAAVRMWLEPAVGRAKPLHPLVERERWARG